MIGNHSFDSEVQQCLENSHPICLQKNLIKEMREQRFKGAEAHTSFPQDILITDHGGLLKSSETAPRGVPGQ